MSVLTKGEVNNLVGLVKKLDVGNNSNKRPRRRRTRRNNRVLGPTMSTTAMPAAINVAVESSGSRRRRRARGNGAVADGSVRLKRREIFVDFKPTDGIVQDVVDFYPDSSSLPFLKKYFDIYEKVEFHSVRIDYVPAVGSSTNGRIIFGYDASGDKSAPTKRADVAMLMPVVDVPVWQPGHINLNKNQLMSRKNYSIHNFGTEGENPGALKYRVDVDKTTTTTVGEFWVSYDLTLSGPRN